MRKERNRRRKACVFRVRKKGRKDKNEVRKKKSGGIRIQIGKKQEDSPRKRGVS